MLSRFIQCLSSFLRMALLALAIPLALICTASSAFAHQRVFVDKDSTVTTPTGAGWTTAYRYLSEGIARAVDLSSGGTLEVQVWVAEGTYRPDESEANPTGNNDRALSFQMHNNVKLYGGFEGDEAATPAGFNERMPLSRLTILSGDIDSDDVLDDDNSYHVVYAKWSDWTAIIDGFVVTMGYANDAPVPFYGQSTANPDNIPAGTGGGMLILGSMSEGPHQSHPTVLRCTFENNSADYGGGTFQHGMQLTFPGPSFINCVWKNNAADVEGGGFHSFAIPFNVQIEAPCPSYNPLLFYNCLFVGNDAPTGGALLSGRGSFPKLINCTVVANSNGIFQQVQNDCGSTTLRNSIVYRNGTCTAGNCPFDDQIDGCFSILDSCVQNLPGTLTDCQSKDTGALPAIRCS
jgi:hypothetical protein